MIRNGAEYAAIEGEAKKDSVVRSGQSSDKYRVFLSAEKKQYTINGCKVGTEEFYGDFGCVLMSDRDMLILRGNPEDRRKFIDRAVSNTDKIYLSALLRYNRTLRQRNSLLRRAKETRLPLSRLKGEIEAWNAGLVEAAHEIMIKREIFVEKLLSSVRESYRSLFGSSEELTMMYEPCVKKKLATMLQK